MLPWRLHGAGKEAGGSKIILGGGHCASQCNELIIAHIFINFQLSHWIHFFLIWCFKCQFVSRIPPSLLSVWPEEPPTSKPDLLAGCWVSDSRHFSPGDYFQMHLQFSSDFFFWGKWGLPPALQASVVAPESSSFEQDCTCFPVINGEMDFLTPSDSEVSAPPSSSEHTPSSFSQASYTYSSSHFPFVISLKKEKKRKPSPITSLQLTRVTQTFPFHEQLSHVGKQSAQ